MSRTGVERWHACLQAGDANGISALLADDAVFHSPVVHTPQVGKALTAMYLSAAYALFSKADFQYVREVVGDDHAALEFTAELDGIHINGIDLIHWNAAGQIDDFKVMIRPLKAVNMLHGLMRQLLEARAG